MIIRTASGIKAVNWGNGLSHRFLTEADGMGFTLTDTIVWAGTSSKVMFDRHIEACYCVAGHGYLTFGDGQKVRLAPGTMYAPDQHDPHELSADPDGDLRLVCVLVPALQGDETHNLDATTYSGY